MEEAILNFLETYGVKGEEATDPEMMINMGFFWSDKYKRYIPKNSTLYDDNDYYIVDYIRREG